jgi:hypothetical protein
MGQGRPDLGEDWGHPLILGMNMEVGETLALEQLFAHQTRLPKAIGHDTGRNQP